MILDDKKSMRILAFIMLAAAAIAVVVAVFRA